MARVAFYARCPSDNQRDASIEDQLRQCRERAAREGWTIVETYSDRAISGASLIRSGIQSLLADAQAGRFDMMLSEVLDRISRDEEDVGCLQASPLRWRDDPHPVGRRDQRASCRSQRRHERPFPERPIPSSKTRRKKASPCR